MADLQERISPEILASFELWALKEELEVAKKARDGYAHLARKLYHELDTLRNGICDKCKTKFIVGAASSSSTGSSSSLTPIPASIPLGGRPAQNQTNPGSPQTVAISDVRNTELPTQQASIEPTFILSTTPPQTSAAVDDIPEDDRFVVHNPEVEQALDVHLAHTLKMKSGVYCVKFSREGKYLAVGLGTGETYIYDMKTLSYRVLKIVEYPPKNQPAITCMQFSPDDKYIATGQYNGHIRIWNVAERRVLATFEGHTDCVVSVDFSPNGRLLLSGSWDGSVRIWCMRDGSPKKFLDPEMDITSAAISRDGRYIAAGGYSEGIRIWDFRSGQLLQRWEVEEVLWSVVFTSDGKRLLSGGDEMILKSWDISSLMDYQPGSSRGNLVSSIIDVHKECLTFQGHTETIYSVSIFPNSRWVLSASGDSTARIWDVRTGVWQCILSGHEDAAEAADASPDGCHLATGANGSVRVWRYEQVG